MDVDGLASDVDAGEIRWLALDPDVTLENHARILGRLRVLLWLVLPLAGDIDVIIRKDNGLNPISKPLTVDIIACTHRRASGRHLNLRSDLPLR